MSGLMKMSPVTHLSIRHDVITSMGGVLIEKFQRFTASLVPFTIALHGISHAPSRSLVTHAVSSLVNHSSCGGSRRALLHTEPNRSHLGPSQLPTSLSPRGPITPESPAVLMGGPVDGDVCLLEEL